MPKIIAKKEDWVELGFQLFAEGGEKALVVEKMAASLKCNKSSFYWHFNSKREFIDAIISYWMYSDTQKIIQEVERSQTPLSKFSIFIQLIFRKDPYLEFIFHLKRYAVKQMRIQPLLDQIDEERMAFTANLFQELGMPPEKAFIGANIFYKYLIGYHEMIRFKPQSSHYEAEVREELSYFLPFIA